MRVDRRFVRRLAAAAALVAAALLHSPAELRAREDITLGGIVMPSEVDGAERGEVRDFEPRAPGLGQGVSYKKAGWLIDVFVYDLRQAVISGDVEGEQVRAQLEQAMGDVVRAERARSNAVVREHRRFHVSAAPGEPRLACAAFVLPYEGQPEHLDSTVCVGALANKFVKLRITTRNRAAVAAESEQLLQAFVRAVWKS